MVRTIVPPDHLLEYQVREGWGPLCEFLNKEVPSKRFPKVNNTEAFRRFYVRDSRRQYLNILKITTMVVIPLLAISSAIWWRNRT